VNLEALQSAGRFITLQGVITRVEWVNPHVFIYVNVADATGSTVTNWALEVPNPRELAAAGVAMTNLKVGSKITAKGMQMHAGSHQLEVPQPDPSWLNPR